MIQQVNLYQNQFKQERKYSILLYPVSVFMFLLISMSCFQLWSMNSIETQRLLAQEQLDNETEKVNGLLAKLPSQEENTLLTAEIVNWQTRLQDLQQIIALLKNKGSADTQGFAGYLQALANQPTQDIWLTKIHIIKDKSNITLAGSTFKSDRIPSFLKQLQQEPAFHNQTFENLIMQQSEHNDKQIDFTISSENLKDSKP